MAHGRDDFVCLSMPFGNGEAVHQATPGEGSSDAEPPVAAAARRAELVSDDYLLARKALAMRTGSWLVSATLSGNADPPGLRGRERRARHGADADRR